MKNEKIGIDVRGSVKPSIRKNDIQNADKGIDASNSQSPDIRKNSILLSKHKMHKTSLSFWLFSLIVAVIAAVLASKVIQIIN